VYRCARRVTVQVVLRGASLAKKDGGEGSHKGHHHFLDKSLVAEVEGNKARLSAVGAVAVTMEEEK
jgi:hypothetical protein